MVTPKITLREAMGTLSTMFPTFDEETIKGVLYQTNGHMERTIEILLSLTGEESPSEQSTTEPPLTSTTTTTQQNPTTTNTHSSNRSRHTLDDDFLRYSNLDPATGASSSSGGHQQNTDQLNQDEYYAQRLQQALFDQGLSNIPPTQRPTYEYGVDNSSYAPPTSSSRRNVDSGYSTRGIGSSNATTAPETSTFDQLSDLAKKKFSDFKNKYFNNNRANNNQPVDKEEETMNRGLLLRDDDEENDRL